ncbi:MAG TPA: hypothetical protein VFR37_04965 [Longimicrobium sp.]|nr:hypothetical protein [Longimicrobium sp.]
MENRQTSVSGVNRSVVSIGNAGSITNQVVQAPGEAGSGSLEDLLAQLGRLLPEMPLQPAARDEIQAEIRTARAQLGSSRPKSTIIRESLRTIRGLLQGVAGNAAYAQLVVTLDGLLA